MDCDQLMDALGDGLALRCEKQGEDLFVTLPIQGLDGYGLTFWCTRSGGTWHLSDDGHLSNSLWGVSGEKVAERVSLLAGDLPVSIVDGALVAELVGETADENVRIFSTAIEAVLGAWSLRLEQHAPTLEIGLREQIASRLAHRGIRSQSNVEIRGRSGLARRFDLAAGDAGRGLLRVVDTDNPTHFQRAAELYIVSSDDVRAAHTGLSHNFVFAWNLERLSDPNILVLRELESHSVYPTGEVDEAALMLAS